MDKKGNYDGGAGGKFNGRHHYEPDWREKTRLMKQLTEALQKGANSQNVSLKGTNQGNNGGKSQNRAIMKTKLEQKEMVEQIWGVRKVKL